MIYKEVYKDLFEVSDDYYLAHCISADFQLGKGIAVEFDKRFDMKNKLKEKFPEFETEYKIDGNRGCCFLIDNVLNLITKEKYWYKPTYKTLTESLKFMKDICIKSNVKKVAMPLIGCGLDKLKWNKVSKIIKDIFKDTDIEILVCKRND